MIRNLFFDLDDTLLDFRLSERSALTETLVSFGIPVPDALPDRYAAINADYWHRLERGEVTRDALKVLRFRDLFRVSGITGIDPEAVTHAYEERLASRYFLIPDAHKTLAALHGRYRLFAASNGTGHIQRARLAGAGIAPLFDGLFISAEIGAEKPSPAFFDAIFTRFPLLVRTETVMIGDSLTSDIAGGQAAGLRTVLFDQTGQKSGNGIRPDLRIRSLNELPSALETLDRAAGTPAQ